MKKSHRELSPRKSRWEDHAQKNALGCSVAKRYDGVIWEACDDQNNGGQGVGNVKFWMSSCIRPKSVRASFVRATFHLFCPWFFAWGFFSVLVMGFSYLLIVLVGKFERMEFRPSALFSDSMCCTTSTVVIVFCFHCHVPIGEAWGFACISPRSLAWAVVSSQGHWSQRSCVQRAAGCSLCHLVHARWPSLG